MIFDRKIQADALRLAIDALGAEGRGNPVDLGAMTVLQDMLDKLERAEDKAVLPAKLTPEMREVLTVMLTDCHSVEESYADLLAAAAQSVVVVVPNKDTAVVPIEPPPDLIAHMAMTWPYDVSYFRRMYQEIVQRAQG